MKQDIALFHLMQISLAYDISNIKNSFIKKR